MCWAFRAVACVGLDKAFAVISCLIVRNNGVSLSLFPPPQCCPLCWYRETASSTQSIRCCPVSATLCSRMTRTCRRTPPSPSPLPRPTRCPPPSPTHRGTATPARRAAAATPPFRTRHPAPTPAARSRYRVSLARMFHLFFS